uniref:Uncharacterized protein n=1 Tax=Panagrolaimus sp. PS1159 TaxID=55785 RepID=A0AC35GTD6_9BILA
MSNQQDNNQPQPPPQKYQNSAMNENYSLGYSFSLSIVAGIFLVMAAIFGTIAACMNGSGEYPRDHRIQTSMAA